MLPVLANGGPLAVVVPDFREVDFGDWTGLSWAEVEKRYGMSAFAWLDELEAARVRNAESAAKLQARLEPPLREITNCMQANRWRCFAMEESFGC